MTAPLPVRRHHLITLQSIAWEQVLADLEPASHACQCLRQWQARGWPLVVSRQAGELRSGQLQAGIPLPTDWGRQRLSLIVPHAFSLAWGGFPPAHEAQTLLPVSLAQDWLSLCQQLQVQGCMAQVYGSYGWELITGQGYVREGSDLDLMLPVQSATQADRLVKILTEAGDITGLPRLDGELLFPNDDAIAWREWQQWRSGASSKVLIKRTHGLRIQAHSDWPEHAPILESSHAA
ncbi:malonate decarboxylase holo-[acyl-carrier-protein] synthase [Alcaligenes sp. SORT26]|uniref:malonate decarboxylase holo-[acyl-carrier-protein] synthase n=1 Tax=Alcaligenes sp. SORT26 TaxID=2813780 RepID=UPI001A9CCC0F|nr:malonate decarboxylase holo-[acyl-carrier-protein] synthase [Alcaligenes sp. SORT26]QTB99864.1 malonate decarboxylase holo-[acyl-carrier-protein] synthase [Alcaligenes sp. SORT26]